jgi:cytochrome c-type biogenesis protein CcmH/NrfG
MILRSILTLLVCSPLVAADLPSQPAAALPDLSAAKTLYHSRHDAEAKQAFEHIVETDPNNHDAFYHLGRLAKRRCDWPAVAKYYERCTKLAPDNPDYWTDLGEAYGKLAKKGGVFEQMRMARRCREALEKAVALAPDNIQFRRWLIDFCKQAPGIVGGGTEPALAQAAEISKRDPYEGAMAVGDIHTNAKHWSKAEAALREAAALRPSAPEPWLALGKNYVAQGRTAEARVAFNEVLKVAPGHPEATAALEKLKP